MIKTEKEITNFPNELGWQERERGFKLLNEVCGEQGAAYSMFVYTETKIFEKEYSRLNATKEYAYVCKGDLERLLNDLQIYHFDQNSLTQTEEGHLKLLLTETCFRDDFIRQPKKRTVEGVFYQLTEGEFKSMPFGKEPMPGKRDIFLAVKMFDSVPLSNTLKGYIAEYCTPVQTDEKRNNHLTYRPIVVEDVKRYVPHKVNEKAFETAIRYQLTNVEFNFLNYFYETGKAMRNDVGQIYFDKKSKGIGWRHDRKWVKDKMKRLIQLELVKFEIRHDCRDRRYTSWYFYDSNANLDNLKHDF